MTAAPEHELAELLERAGAKVYGRRASCPECKRPRSVSFDEAKGVYHCHGAGCGFSGGMGSLRQRVGIRRQWLPRSEYMRQRQDQQRADREARKLYARVQGLRLWLLNELRGLGRLELLAHNAGPDHPATWGALALVDRQRPQLEAQLDFLESATAAELVRFFENRDDYYCP